MESSRPPAQPHSAWLSLVEQTRPALHLLLRAYVYANEADDEGWHFAVELADLRLGGLMPSDLCWLITQGLLELQNEDAGPHPSANGNGHSAEPGFCDGSRFLPTPAGFHRLRDILENPTASASELPQPASIIPVRPLWDPTLRELRVGEILVKRYRVPAKTQERILNAFQEEDWPRRIDDPLPPVPDISPKRHLSTAITALNRNQKTQAIHFQGDGCGEGVIWECDISPDESVAD